MFSKVLLVLIAVVFSFSARTFGQIVEPTRILSRDTLLLVDIRDTPSLISDFIPNWYDLFYGDAVESKRMLPLNFPTLPVVLNRASRFEPHWLQECFSEGIGNQQALVEMRRLAGLLRSGLDEAELVEVKESAVETLSALFSGRSFIAIEDKAPCFRVVFGIEYDPAVFDWKDSLVQSAESQSDGMPTLIDKVFGIEIHFLRDEEIYFFTFKDTLYGVCDTDVSYAKRLAERISGSIDVSNSLESSRYYQRARRRLNLDVSIREDVFCFARIEDLLSRKMQGYGEDKNELKGLEKYAKDSLGWSNAFGAVFEVGGKHHLAYRICYPLIQPKPDYLVSLFSHLGNLDPELDRKVPPGASWMAYVCHEDSSELTGLTSSFDIPGDEFSIKHWKKFCNNKKLTTQNPDYDKEGFDLALTNVFSRKKDPIEVCKFATVLSDPKHNFFDGRQIEMELFRGVFLDTQQSAFEESEITPHVLERLNSKEFKSIQQAESKDEDMPFGEFSKERIDSTQFTDFGIQRPVFSYAKNEQGATIFSRVGGSTLTKRAMENGRIISGPAKRFNIGKLLAPDLNSLGLVKGITARRNFAANSVEWQPISPLLKFVAYCQQGNCHSYDYKSKIRGDSNVSFLDRSAKVRKWSLLTRISRLPFSLFDSNLNEVKNLEVMPLGNMDVCWFDIFVIDQEFDALEYIGVLTSKVK